MKRIVLVTIALLAVAPAHAQLDELLQEKARLQGCERMLELCKQALLRYGDERRVVEFCALWQAEYDEAKAAYDKAKAAAEKVPVCKRGERPPWDKCHFRWCTKTGLCLL